LLPPLLRQQLFPPPRSLSSLRYEVVRAYLDNLVLVIVLPGLIHFDSEAHLHWLVEQCLNVLERTGVKRLTDIGEQPFADRDRLLAWILEIYIMEDLASLIRTLGNFKHRKQIGAVALLRRLNGGLGDLRRVPARHKRNEFRSPRVLRGGENFRQFKVTTH